MGGSICARARALLPPLLAAARAMTARVLFVASVSFDTAVALPASPAPVGAFRGAAFCFPFFAAAVAAAAAAAAAGRFTPDLAAVTVLLAAIAGGC